MGALVEFHLGEDSYEFDIQQAMFRIGNRELEHNPEAELVMAAMIAVAIDSENPAEYVETYKKLGMSEQRAIEEVGQKMQVRELIKALKDLVDNGLLTKDGQVDPSDPRVQALFSQED